MNKKKYCKSVIDKQAFDLCTNRTGYIESISFHNKDYSICWVRFVWSCGAYLRDINEINIISTQLTLFD